jgi:hypothetical protein
LYLFLPCHAGRLKSKLQGLVRDYSVLIVSRPSCSRSRLT